MPANPSRPATSSPGNDGATDGPPPGADGAPREGETVGPWTLEERLGKGSMGEVWRASGPDGPVALKLPAQDAFVRHLRREGLLLAEIDHPNVARCLDADLEGPRPWLAMELAPGQPLRSYCTGTIRSAQATLLADQILVGLGAIHDAGIVHLDLKPENVLVDPDGRATIVDLGLGRAVSRHMAEVYLSVSLASRQVPRAGTLAYMAPEQRRGEPADGRADLYAFGVLLHELLSGKLPDPSVRLSSTRRILPPRWDVVVGKLTHPDPARRPPDARAARHLVSFTLEEKDPFHLPPGGREPRDPVPLEREMLEAASPWSPGMFCGGHELLELLGRGGYGEVWRARREDEEVALKIALAEEAREALREEAELASRIDHPAVPDVLAVEADDDPPHLVLELVEGTSLRLILHADDPLPVDEALSIFEGMVETVRACHEAGVAHRDVKPEHFLIERDGPDDPRIRLIDFGLAARLPREGVEGSLTTRDDVRGTWDYMAPEQKEGASVHPSADVYALGVCLFELLTRELPRGPQRAGMLRSGVPGRIDQLTLRMMARFPERRPDLEAVAREVRKARPGRDGGLLEEGGAAIGRRLGTWLGRGADLIRRTWTRRRAAVLLLISAPLLFALLYEPPSEPPDPTTARLVERLRASGAGDAGVRSILEKLEARALKAGATEYPTWEAVQEEAGAPPVARTLWRIRTLEWWRTHPAGLQTGE